MCALIELGQCDLETFLTKFADLRREYDEVGHAIAEALLSKRGLAKADVKALAAQCAPPGEELATPQTHSATDAWAPPEVGPLVGRPFSLASARFNSGTSGWKALTGFTSVQRLKHTFLHESSKMA